MLLTFVGFLISQVPSQVLNVSLSISIGSPVHSFAGKHQPSKSPAHAAATIRGDNPIEMIMPVTYSRIEVCPQLEIVFVGCALWR